MSDKSRDLTLEHVNRLATAVADLMENQNSHNRMILSILKRLDERLDTIDAKLASLSKDLRERASEQGLLGTRVDNAFSRALRNEQLPR